MCLLYSSVQSWPQIQSSWNFVAETDFTLHSVPCQQPVACTSVHARSELKKFLTTFTSIRRSTLVVLSFLPSERGLPATIHSFLKLHVLLSCFIKCTKLPVHLGCTSCLFLLYSQASWWHAEKEPSVRELREALLQLSCVKGKTSRVWVQSLTSVCILACVEISRWVQKDRVTSRFSFLCHLGSCQWSLERSKISHIQTPNVWSHLLPMHLQ